MGKVTMISLKAVENVQKHITWAQEGNYSLRSLDSLWWAIHRALSPLPEPTFDPFPDEATKFWSKTIAREMLQQSKVFFQ